jgi:hypothetical protein
MTFLELAHAIDQVQVELEAKQDALNVAQTTLTEARHAYDSTSAALTALYAEMQTKIGGPKVSSDPSSLDLKNLYLTSQKATRK